nr:MAG TPA: hypothetical protein [Caudoviricetes sp.]
MPFSSDFRMLIPQQSRPHRYDLLNQSIRKKEGINHAEQYPQHKPAL